MAKDNEEAKYDAIRWTMDNDGQKQPKRQMIKMVKRDDRWQKMTRDDAKQQRNDIFSCITQSFAVILS